MPVSISSWGFKSPLAHAMFPDRSRRRRRWRLVIPAVVTVIALLFWAAGNFQSDTLASTAFHDAARDLGTTQALNAESFNQLVTSPVSLDRDRYIAQLDQIQASVAESLVSLPAEEELSPQTRGTLRLAIRMLESWQRGLEKYEEATLAVVDQPANTVAVAELGDALASLAVGDGLYAVLAEEVALLRADLEITASDMPPVAYLPPAGTTPDFLGMLVNRLQAAQTLVGRRGIVIANVVTVPEPTGGLENGVTRLPFVEMLEVQVVVSNNGNLPEENLTVLVQLKSQLGNLITQQTRRVAIIETGAQVTVSFKDLPVVGGGFYGIVAGVLTETTGDSPPPESLEVFIAESAPIPDTTGG